MQMTLFPLTAEKTVVCWFQWEWLIEFLVPSWWKYLGRIRKCGFAGGGVSLCGFKNLYHFKLVNSLSLFVSVSLSVPISVSDYLCISSPPPPSSLPTSFPASLPLLPCVYDQMSSLSYCSSIMPAAMFPPMIVMDVNPLEPWTSKLKTFFHKLPWPWRFVTAIEK